MAAGRYLLIRLSAIGDVVFGLEALEALRREEPEARIDWLVEDRAAMVLREHPELARVVCFPRRELSRALPRPWLWPSAALRAWRFARELRAERYDAVLDLHGNLKSGLQLGLARSRRKIGFASPRAREASWFFARERVELPRPRPHRADEGLALVARLLGREVARADAEIPERAEAAARARSILDRQAQSATGKRVILAPGTSAFATFKRWPAERFAQLARKLVDDGHNVLVTSGPGEEELAERVVGDTSALWIDGAREGLDVTIEVMRRADACVAADSGPLHLAQAAGLPVVALFGPKNPDVYGPRRSGSVVLRYPTSCTPCGRRRCDMPVCVRGIVVDDVHRALQRVLEEAACAAPLR